MKFSKNQAGFSVVEVFVIIVILAIIGFAGYFVYHSEHNSDKDHDKTASQVNKDTNTSPNSAAADNHASTATYADVPAGLQEAIKK